MSDYHQVYMRRCLELARLGAGFVAPNPMVGAVLVHQDRIIGEGWHGAYGGPHAEVNCIHAVSEEDRHFIPESTMYVSLEPCAHFGKTPPCSQLIIDHRIPKVVIACRDPFAAVNGRGIEQLQKAGIEVITGILEAAAIELNRRFFCFHEQKRPYVILKWAQTADGYIASNTAERLLITHEQTNLLVHQWRSEEAAILIGTETALKDNPSLTNRYWHGKSPLRMVIDKQLRLPENLTIFTDGNPLIVFNEEKTVTNGAVQFVQMNRASSFIDELFVYCYTHAIQSILVEGGARLLKSFLNENKWNETRVLTNTTLQIGAGLAAPVIQESFLHHSFQSATDQIDYYTNPQHVSDL